MAFNRNLRVLAGLSVLASAALIMLPHVTSYISHSAVINAPVVVIKSPFEGVMTSAPRRPGEVIGPDEAIVSIGASREVRTVLARLEARKRAAAAEQAAIAVESAALRRLDDDLAARMHTVTAVARDVLGIDRARLDHEIAGARAAMRQQAARLETRTRLSGAGSVSMRDVDDARTDLAIARETLAALEVQRRRIDRELAAIGEGALPAFGSEDGSYSRQRRDEIAIRLADLATRHEMAGAELRSLDDEIAAVRAEMAQLRAFAPRSREGAVVWTATPGAGAAVPDGDEILQVLDCSRRFVEVEVSEKAYHAVTVGTTAWVRLRGSETAFLAEVETIRGAGSTPETGRLAARPLNTVDGNLTAILRLAPPDLTDAATGARFCDVGRTAEVRFDRGLVENIGVQWRMVQVELRVLFDRLRQPA